MGGTWSLAIDFGTTATVAAILDDRGQYLTEIDGERSIPSTVAWVDGRLVVGREAERRRVFRPESGAARPKQLLGRRRTILLGDQAVPAHEAVGAILRAVADAATAQQGRAPVATVLTHPVRWSDEQLDQLVAAARTAMLPDVHLLPEPVAAAFHVGGGLVVDGHHVAVYDLGGGTFDSAVLTKSAGSFELAGPPGGDDRFGGDDIDARLTATVLDRIGARSTEWAAQLRDADDPLWRHAHAELTLAVRQAKEALSRQTTASVMLGAPMSGEVRVTRPELEALIGPELRHTLDQFTATVERAGLSLSDLDATYVTGGASRTPLVARLLHDALGRPPDTFDDPKAVVAMGANRWLHQTSNPARDEPGRDDRPVPASEPVAVAVAVAVTTDPAAPAAPPPPTEPATPETPFWRRRPTVTWVVGAALVAGAVAMAVMLVGLIGDGDGADDVTIAVDGTPTGVAFGDGSVWAAVDGPGEVVRVEADSNLISSTVAVGDAPLGVAYGDDAVWVIDEGSDSVLRVDPATNTVVARVAVGRRPLAVTARGDAVWVANYDDGSVSRIDATSNAVVATVTVGRGPVAISADDGAVWVANGDENSVSRVDPATNQRQLTIAVGTQPLAIATGAGGVWVASFADQSVLRIDPERNLVAGEVTVGRGPAALALDGDDLWVANSQDDSVMRVDVDELVVVGTQATGSGPAALAVGEGSLWVANAVGRTITRLPAD